MESLGADYWRKARLPLQQNPRRIEAAFLVVDVGQLSTGALIAPGGRLVMPHDAQSVSDAPSIGRRSKSSLPGVSFKRAQSAAMNSPVKQASAPSAVSPAMR